MCLTAAFCYLTSRVSGSRLGRTQRPEELRQRLVPRHRWKQTVRPADSALHSRLFFSTFAEACWAPPSLVLWEPAETLVCQTQTCPYATQGNSQPKISQPQQDGRRAPLAHLSLMGCRRGNVFTPAMGHGSDSNTCRGQVTLRSPAPSSSGRLGEEVGNLGRSSPHGVMATVDAAHANHRRCSSLN